ncbi:DUF3786 domain-containing protein [Candidatus Latescibacterota bacterium]
MTDEFKGPKKRFNLARDLARSALKEFNLRDIAKKAGGELTDSGAGTDAITFHYLGKKLSVKQPDMDISVDPDDWADMGKQLSIQEEIFILHYLVNATGKSPSGNLIPFRNMDGGMVYESVFRGRAVNRLVHTFRDKEDMLLTAGNKLGGTPGDMGSVSLKLQALPNFVLTIILWKGDEEMPSSGNILFDDSVTDYLPTEDCTVLAESVAGRLVHELSQLLEK